MSNYRRSAGNNHKNGSYTASLDTNGSDERTKLVSQLTDDMRSKMISREIFEMGIGRAIFFLCEPCNKNSHSVAIETNTAIDMRVVGIGYSDKKDNQFILQCFCDIPDVSDMNDKYNKSYGQYFASCVSAVRSIEYGDDRKTYKVGSYRNAVSKMEIIETYFALLHGTIKHYYETRDFEDVKMIWLILSSIRYIARSYIDKSVNYANESYKVYDRFVTMFKTRDDSLYNATEFKSFVDNLSPIVYYYCLYNAMISEHDIVHKSSIGNGTSLLNGLILMHMVGDIVTIDGIDDSFLRILYERSTSCFSTHNMKEFLVVDDLVRYLHENAMSRFMKYMRYNMFFVLLYRDIFTRDNITCNQFMNMINYHRNFVGEINSIVEASLIVAPNCERYLSNENIAEFVASAIVNIGNAKFKLLTTKMFDSRNINSGELHKIIRSNIERVQNVQKQLEQSSAVAAQFNGTNFNAKQMYEQFVAGERLKEHNIFNPRSVFNFKIILRQIICNDSLDDIEKIKEIIKFMNFECKPLYIGSRTIMKLVRFCCIRDGTFNNWLNGQGVQVIDRSSVFGRHGQDMANAVAVPTTTIVQMISDINDDIDNDVVCVHYEPFESSLTRNIERMKQYLKNIGAIKRGECSICFNNRPMVPLHGDVRHAVCIDCKKRITDECPFCRFKLNGEPETDGYDTDDTNDSYYSDY